METKLNDLTDLTNFDHVFHINIFAYCQQKRYVRLAIYTDLWTSISKISSHFSLFTLSIDQCVSAGDGMWWLDMIRPRMMAAQNIKFSIKDLLSKCDQIHSFLWICSHLLKKLLIENFILCAVDGMGSRKIAPEENCPQP